PTSVILSQTDLPAPASAARLRASVARLTTPVVVVPRRPEAPGAAREALPAGEPVPAGAGVDASGVSRPRATSQPASRPAEAIVYGRVDQPRRVLVSTPAGMRPGVLMPSAPSGESPVLVSSPSGRVVGHDG